MTQVTCHPQTNEVLSRKQRKANMNEKSDMNSVVCFEPENEM